MDFTLREKNSDIHLEDFFSYIIEEFHLAGHEVVIQKKDILSPLRRSSLKKSIMLTALTVELR
jgi:hypothetical protein